MRLIYALCLAPALVAPALAQVSTANPPGSDSMSRATNPPTQSQSAPEAAARAESSTDQNARPSDLTNRNQAAPDQTNRRPDQGK